jgi:hypothetical protein
MIGFSHRIFVLKPPSGQRWILSIAKSEFASALVNRRVFITKHITNVQLNLQIPAVVNTTKDHAIFDYINRAPIYAYSPTVGEQKRHKLLDGLANFLYKLWTCLVPASNPSEIRQ